MLVNDARIYAVTSKVGTGSKMTGYPTYQELASRSVSAVWRRHQSLNCFTLECLGIRAFTSSNPGTAAQRSLLPAFRSSWFHSGLSWTQKPSRSLPLPSC